jgi:GT2 family glycosyltransferase
MLEALEGADAAKGVYSRGGIAVIQRLAQVEFEERYAILRRGDSIDLIDTYSAAFRRNALEAVDGFDEAFPLPDHEDVDLSYRLAESGFRLVFAPRARVAHSHPSGWLDYARLKLSRGRWRVRVLRRFPSRSTGDGYTPVSMRLQIILAGLLPAAVAASFLRPAAIAAYLGAWLLTSASMAVHAARTDPGVLPLVPAFCLVRAFALACGLVGGVVREAACLRR